MIKGNDMQKDKIFQDSTQGYISIPEIYVSELIDTEEMQRLKDVSQTGLKALYSGATHDRFSHSLGVYHIGSHIYEAFKKNISNMVKDLHLSTSFDVEKNLEDWRELFYIACLLHDIGHPAFSHTLEFILNSPYVCIDLPENNLKNYLSIDTDEVDRLFSRYLVASPTERDKTYLKVSLLKKIRESEKDATFSQFNSNNYLEDFNPAPHEMMGAYIILSDGKLQDRIRKSYGKEMREEDYAFIARMITGIKYDPLTPSEKSIELSLRNCVISLLNGKIDADSIDYLNRNSHFAGYATSKLDLTRLCDSFSAFFDENRKIFVPCLKKSALSTLDGFVSARNFEPKWLYSHHKIVYYNDFLIKFLVKMCGTYLFAISQKNWEKIIVSNLKNKNSKFYVGEEGAKTWLLIFDYFQSNPEQQRKYKNWNEFFKNQMSEISKDKSIFKSLARISSDLRDILIESINPTHPWVSYARYELLDFLIGIIEFYSNKILNSYVDNGDNKIISGLIQDFIIVINFIRKINDMFGKLRVNFTSYFFSPQAKVEIKLNNGDLFRFNFSTDAHLKKLFHDFNMMFPVSSSVPEELLYGDENNQALVAYNHRLFTKSLEEYKTRKLKQTLWKTYEEYNIFINSLSLQYNIPVEIIIEELRILIFRGHRIDFEDVIATICEKKDPLGKSIINREHVYSNYPKDYSAQERVLFDSVFGFFGEGLIIRFYTCRFKDFSHTKIQFEDNIHEYGKVVQTYYTPNYTFPYIYYCHDALDIDVQGYSRQQIIEKFGKNLANYILEKIVIRGEKMGSGNFDVGKIIRDSVHGDIFVPNRFLKIIECKAFQRLHRIKQLATADMVFPEAVHTRFAHSLGTFYITNLMLNHFCDILDKLKYSYTQKEKDAILAAALLHDIGHGPYSHAYEHVAGNSKSHETWTKEIIRHDPELSAVLKNEFGYDFPENVISCLDKRNQSDGGYSLFRIFSVIISSNLDADRMDYLMRDAYNTGMKFGVIDLQKLISSMELVERDGQPEIALRIDALSSIEQFIFGRYNMYAEVYFVAYKLALEKILERICERIDSKDLYRKDLDGRTDKTSWLYGLFNNKADLHTYLKMDDYSFMHEIEKVVEHNPNDIILVKLLESLKYRGGFKRMRMSNLDAKKFFMNWKKVFPQADKVKYGVICVGEDFQAYTLDENEILIVCNNGVVKLFSEVSRLFEKINTKKLWYTNTGYVYFNEEILRGELAEMNITNIDKTISDLKMLFDKYDSNKHTEIENKYDCSKGSIEAAKCIGRIFESGRLKGFKCDGQLIEKKQKDTYYDTDSFILAKNKFSFRCRESGSDVIFTVKKPAAKTEKNKQAQFLRSEFEEKRSSSNIREAQNLFDEYLAEELGNVTGVKSKLDDLHPVVTIINDRTSYIVRDDDESSSFCCEVSLDSIKYIDANGNEKRDYQVEIELKCKYSYRLRMNRFAECFCEEVGISGTSRAKESKYIKAVTSLNLY